MTPPDGADEPSMGELSWRLRALETTVGKLEAHTTEGLAKLSAQIAGLTFVRLDVYEVEKAAVMRAIDALHQQVADARVQGRWVLGLMAAPMVGAVVVAVGRLL